MSYFMQLDLKNYIYKYIFYLSAMCLLLKGNQHRSSENRNYRQRNLYKYFNTIVTLVTTLITTFSFSSFFYYGKLLTSNQVIGALCLHLVYALFRIQLYNCLNELRAFKRKSFLIPCSSYRISYLPFRCLNNWLVYFLFRIFH